MTKPLCYLFVFIGLSICMQETSADQQESGTALPANYVFRLNIGVTLDLTDTEWGYTYAVFFQNGISSRKMPESGKFCRLLASGSYTQYGYVPKSRAEGITAIQLQRDQKLFVTTSNGSGMGRHVGLLEGVPYVEDLSLLLNCYDGYESLRPFKPGLPSAVPVTEDALRAALGSHMALEGPTVRQIPLGQERRK